ncbi:polysaccharide deacetylase family protein [Litoribacter alkaliphilus]|uniref:Polysaccharide deacetylase family protein n=1 Tax=Litoribacter ruber TaxID=702568 RepID=A0AAP2CGK9_9BACT|nr:polysaccharide deacetylase family protein [Litoribacter alkaliphilus]MBS9524253.1 polysaccharide deacetylase family protein [Litoribacter alkaliphilus]
MKKNLRNVVAFPLAKLLIKLGFVKRALKKAKEGNFILSVYFHNPSKVEFEKTIVWLKSEGMTFISPEQLEEIIDNNLELPKGAVLLTVDDGWQSNEENIVEIANRYQVPVTIFFSTEAIEEGTYWWSYFLKADRKGYPSVQQLKKVSNNERMATLEKIKGSVTLEREAMTLDQLRNTSLSKFVTIGAHTHTHPILTNCDDEKAFEELRLSKEKLENWIGREVKYFAYPNGNYGVREVYMLETLGFKMAFANNPAYLNKQNMYKKMEIPRFGFLEGATFEENMCRIAGIWHSTTNKMKKRSK